MIRLHQQLEKLFGARFNSNEEIIATIKKLSEAGKFDEPKKVAVFAVILDRLGKMEDEIETQLSLQDTITPEPDNQPASQVETPSEPSSDLPATPETPVTPITEPIIETPPVTPQETVPTSPVTPVVDTVPPVATPEPTVPPVVTPPTDTTPTVSNFTPENITDPVTPPVAPIPAVPVTPPTTPDSTTTS